VRTLGIDLASQDEKTGWCVIEWRDGRTRVDELDVGLGDDCAAKLIKDADWTGFDAPFGWPEQAIEALAAHHRRERWPDPPPDDLDLRFRATDRYVRCETKIWPLSLSSDRIAVTAWRCARILGEGRGSPSDEAVSRIGDDRIVAVYPAAAMRRWEIANRRGYKSSGNAAQKAEAREKRLALIEELQTKTSAWLDLDAMGLKKCQDNDDAVDALLASLIARAAATGQTDPVPADRAARAAREGWIHLPAEGSLEALAAEPRPTV
jgi:predicted nuclease with RNAse H fold